MSSETAGATKRSPIPWVLGTLALVAVVGGAAATLHALKSPDHDASDGKIVAARDVPTAVHEQKHPGAFGFPEPPSAFSFHSMSQGQSAGSASFLTHTGSAADIERFYVEKLGGTGWLFLSRKPVDVKPDQRRPQVFPGIRVKWVNQKQHQQLSLLALDDHQKGHSAQAVLTWSPVETKSE